LFKVCLLSVEWFAIWNESNESHKNDLLQILKNSKKNPTFLLTHTKGTFYVTK